MGNPEQRGLRVGTAERQAAVDALGDHLAEGRLDPDEFEERCSTAYAARTAGELDDLFRDLPPGPAWHPAGPVPAPLPAPLPTRGVLPLSPAAPYGVEPATGIPYSDRQKAVAGLLQILLPFGVGRLYSGNVGIGVAQLLTAFLVIGVIWSYIDGIMILAGRPVDQHGRPLR